MSNMIVTGGYGEGIDLNAYADIDWSKSKYELTFNIASTYNINFSLNSFDVKFDIKLNDIKFNINTFDKIFKIDTYDVKFTTKMCI